MSVRLAILGFLLKRNYHGYDLKKTISRLMGMWTDIKTGSIYHALEQLEKAGCVRKVAMVRDSAKPARSVYQLTESGRCEFLRLLRANVLDFKPILLNDDIGVFFGSRIASDELEDILNQKINILKERLALIISHRDHFERYSASLGVVARQLLLRHILHTQAEVEWFEGLRKAVQSGEFYNEQRLEMG